MQTTPSRIITFYSYKGGTGRSMALANVAWILASNGHRVLAVDWDLEAPGLHRYFHPFLADPELTSSRGVIDLIEDFVNAAVGPPGEEEGERWYEAYAEVRAFTVTLRWTFPGSGQLDLVPAGRQGPAYAARVNAFDWQHFYDCLGGGVFLEAVRDRMRRDYDYVLIDSRTGVSDTSGVCTVQMPNSLVVCFTANRQSVEGAAAVAASVREGWGALGGDTPPRRIFPVLMRVELGEKERLERARAHARARFIPFLDHLDASSRDAYWERVEMLYYPYYAYEEILAVFGDRPGESKSLLAAAEQLTAYLTDGAVTALNPPSEDERLRVLAAAGRGEPDLPQPQSKGLAAGRGCRVFVSSTHHDLHDHRARVIHALRQEGFAVGASEERAAELHERTPSPRDRLRGYDLVVLLVAFRRGYVPEGQSLSVVQLEYQAAREMGLGILVFLLGEDEPWPRRFDEMATDPGIRAWLGAQLWQQHTTFEFGLQPATLHVGPAVAAWLAEQEARAQKQAERLAPRPGRLEGDTGPVLRPGAPALVALFERLGGVLDRVPQQLPKLWDELTAHAAGKSSPGLTRDELPLLRRFHRLRDLMHRRRCRVGWLGGSQAGKSSTLNNLLDASQEEGPASPGAGAPVTRVATCIHGLPPGREPTCTIAFLTPEEFETRRLALCRSVLLDPQLALDALIQEVHGRITQDPARGDGPDGAGTAQQAADRAYLLRFLSSYRAHGSAYVREPRREDHVDYARRHQFKNQPQGDEPSPSLLVHEVVIGFPTVTIPPDLELVDLPSLGAGVTVDDSLAHLDGAVIILSAEQVQSREVEELATRLRSRFGHLSGCVWIVVTRFDSLPRAHLESNRAGPTILDNLAQALDRHRIPPQQVLLVGNQLYQQIQAAPDHKPFAAMCGLQGLAVKDGHPVVPDAFARHATLCEAYKDFLTDGGIRRLREVVGRRLTMMVKEKLCAQAALEVRVIADQVRDLLVIARERAGMTFDDIANALGWESQIKVLSTRIDRERDLVEEPGRALQTRLHDCFRQMQPGSSQDYGQEELAQRHRTVGRVLAAEAILAVRQEMLPAIYENITVALRELAQSAKLAPVHLASGLEPLAALEEARRNDLAQPRDYMAVLESLRDDNLFPSDAQQFLTGGQYNRVLERKIDVVVYEATQLVVHGIQQRLQELARELALLGSDTQAEVLREDVSGLIQAVREV